MKWYMYLIMIAALTVLITMMGCASTNTRLVTLNHSYHYDRETPYNERHDGLGVDGLFDEENNGRMGYLEFKNSQYCCGRKKSNMIFATREWNPAEDIYVGLSWFAGDGYGRQQDQILWLGGITFRYEFHPAFSVYSIVTPVVAVDGLMIQYQDGD